VQTLIRRHLFALRLLLLGADAVIAALLFIVAGQFRFGDGQWPTLWAALGVDVRFGALFHAATWVTTLWFLGLYAFRVRWTIARELEDILTASFILTFGTMSFLYLVRLVDVSRSFLFILLIAQPIATMGGRLVLRLFFGWLRGRGYNRTHMVVVGVGEEAQAFADAVERHRDLGIQVIGHLRGPGGDDGVVTRPIIGDGEDLGRIFRERIVDEVAICIPGEATAWTEPLIRLAADEGKHVRVPTAMAARTLELQTEELDGMLIRSYINGPARMFSLLLKRIMDVVGAAAGLIILSPVLLAVASAIVIKDGGPVLFHQTRVGLNGRPFTLYKFRTMDRDAEERFEEVAGQSDTQGAAFKMVEDPRVTRLGAFLRRSSLDELPQLWNVLKGDMSLIGPRPAPPREVVEYDVWHRRRLSMRPGITGLWQVGARLDAHFDERAQLDLEYIDRWSLGLDLRILARTVPAVVGRTGN
jgi:exopolysaccharide biosynthesis polyprenyl glycosylphosphotransferase